MCSVSPNTGHPGRESLDENACPPVGPGPRRASGGDTAVGTGPTAEQGTTAKLVYGLLSDSRYAYRPRALDDSLSADIFKRYLEALDPGKLFFTAEDIKNFQPYA